jgi:DNA-binding NarL/FixJ family response regulator
MMPLKTRILLADDHEVVRNGLRMVLDAQPDLEVVAEAPDGAEAVSTPIAEVVDLAILDISASLVSCGRSGAIASDTGSFLSSRGSSFRGPQGPA